MNTLKMKLSSIDFERVALMIGMTFMEAFGAVMLICTFFDIRFI